MGISSNRISASYSAKIKKIHACVDLENISDKLLKILLYVEVSISYFSLNYNFYDLITKKKGGGGNFANEEQSRFF